MSGIPTTPTGATEFAWELATLHPPQGRWTVEQYLELTDGTNRLIELVDGRLEFLAMPTLSHQLILKFLLQCLEDFINRTKAGLAIPAGLRVETIDDSFREPDLVFTLSSSRKTKVAERYFHGADLVMEIVSPDSKSRTRDYEEKVLDYAAAGIPEYWIVDPQEQKITVLTLAEGADAYSEYGVFKPGDSATSKLLDGFAVEVQAAFDAAKA